MAKRAAGAVAGEPAAKKAATEYLVGAHLYTNRICPFAHRAELAAVARDQNIEYVSTPLKMEIEKAVALKAVTGVSLNLFEGKTPEELQATKADYMKNVNASGEVPTLKTGQGDIITEANIVAAFIDRVSAEGKGTKLSADDPLLDAKMQLAMKRFDGVVPLLYGLLMNQDPAQDKEKAAKLLDGLDGFTSALDPASEYSFGNSLSIVDVHAAPFLYRKAATLGHWRGFDIYTGKHGDRLRKMMTKVQADPSWKKAQRLSEAEAIEAYEGYAHGQKKVEKPTAEKMYAGRGKSKMGE